MLGRRARVGKPGTRSSCQFNNLRFVTTSHLGLPWYRREGFQARVGVPVPEATQWDQGESVGDCTHPIFKYLEKLAAQGEVIFQDATPQRGLALIEENRQARAQAQAQGKAKVDERTGRQTTALIVQGGEGRICLY
jgi:transposase